MKTTVYWCFTLFLLLLSSTGCNESIPVSGNAKEEQTEGDPEEKTVYEVKLTEVEKQIAGRTNVFAFDLLHTVAINNETSGQNVFLSPMSAALALAMLNNGAAGQTREEIHQVLGYEDVSTEDVNAYFRKMISAMQEADPQVAFESAASIWIDNAFPVLNAFVETNAGYYDAEIRNVNMSDAATTDLVNAWCAEKTKGTIPRLLNQPPGGILALINALYFKGVWTIPFGKEDTKEEVFSNQDGSASLLPTMNKKDWFNYHKADRFRLLDLPYGNESFSMTLMLPDEGVSLDDVIEELDAEKWESYVIQLSGCELPVKLPRFRLEYERELLDDLKAMGLRLEEPDFSLIHSTAALAVSRILQKTFVDVGEEGTEAAGVTVLFLSGSTLEENVDVPEPPSFYVDRPFLFFIREKTTGAIFFSGAVRNL
jgi:serpin B